MRDPKDIAKSWLTKAKTEEDCFDSFVFLWFSFNALYNQYLDRSERKAISELLFSPQFRLGESKLNKLINNEHAIFFQNRIIRDCRTETAQDTSENAVVLKSQYSSSKIKLKALLFILYQVRCNLFHGNKIYGRDTDSVVVRHAAGALMKVLEAYLE